MDLPPPRHRSAARSDAGRPIKPANQKAHSLQKEHNPEKNGFCICPRINDLALTLTKTIHRRRRHFPFSSSCIFIGSVQCVEKNL